MAADCGPMMMKQTSSVSSTENEKNIELDEAIVVISLEKNIPGRIHQGGKIRILAENYEQQRKENHQSDGIQYMALVGSGFKADIPFLTNLVRRYICNFWERYNLFPHGYHVAYIISQVMLRFMGYDDLSNRNRFMGQRDYSMDRSLFTSIPHVLKDERQGRGDDGDDESWITIGRPLGLKVFVLEVRLGNQSPPLSHSHAHIRIVEPSGIISPPLLAHALGQGNKRVNLLLHQRYKQGMSIQQVQDTCIDIIKEVLLNENSDTESTLFKDYTLVCEVLKKDGMDDIRRIPVQSMIA